MKLKLKIPLVTGIAIFFILFSVKNLFAQSYPEVKISGSQIRKFTSSYVNGQEYVLQISLPA